MQKVKVILLNFENLTGKRDMFLFLYKDIKSQNVSENGQLFTFLRAQKIRPATIMIVSSPLSCCMTASHRRLPGAGRGAAISIIKFN